MSVFYSGGSSGGGGTPSIPEVTTDPISPTPQQAWVLATPIVAGGTPLGLLLAITQTSIVGYTYALSYHTLENTTVRVALT